MFKLNRLLDSAFVLPMTLGVGVLLCGLIGSTFAAIPDEMKALLEKQRPKEAYELGLKHPEMLGEPLFDYMFGVAAVDSGRVSLGVLALERVLLDNPGDDLARLELARAYFSLGEYQRSREEFNVVKRNQPPAGVVNTLNLYLDEIKRKEGLYKIQYRAFGELGSGYNSNVNVATSVDSIYLPAVGSLSLAASMRPKPSPFGFGALGAGLTVPLDTSLWGFLDFNASGQRYSQVDGYNLAGANLVAGLKFVDGKNEYKISAFGSLAKIDQTPVPNAAGGAIEYVRQLAETQSLLAVLSSVKLTYPTDYAAYNSTLNIATLGYRKGFPAAKWQPVVDVTANLGQQNNTSDRSDLGRAIRGVNVQVSFLPATEFGVSMGLGYTQSNYGGSDFLFDSTRADSLFSANTALQFKLTKQLTARAELTYYGNQSNLALYGYNQWTGALKLRYSYDSQ